MKLSNANRVEVSPKVFRHTGQIDAKELRGKTLVPRLGEVKDGYQRPLDLKKVRGVADSLHSGEEIDGQLVLVLPPELKADWDRPGRALEFSPTSELPVEILAGQHRLEGVFLYLKELEDRGEPLPTRVPVLVAVYVGWDRVEAGKFFYKRHFHETPMSSRHLAEVAHVAGLEQGDARDASDLYDQLIEGPLSLGEGKKPRVARPAFVKAAVPLLSSAGPLRNFPSADRISAVLAYFQALAKAMPDEIQKGAVASAACDVYTDVAQKARALSLLGTVGDGLEQAVEPFRGFSLKALEKRGRVAVADHFRKLVGFQIDRI